MFIQQYSHLPQTGNNPNVHQLVNGKIMRYIHKSKYYSAIKRKEPLQHAATWIHLRNFMLSERSQNLKATYDIIQDILAKEQL